MTFSQKLTQTLSILVALSLSSSCLKKQNLEDPLVGPAVLQSEMFKLLTQDIGQFGFDQIKKGEANVLLMSQRIEETTVRKLYQQVLRVKDVVTSPEGDLNYNFVQSLYYMPNPDQKIENKEIITTSLDGLLQTKPLLKPPIYWYTIMATQWCQLEGVSCHNVVVTNESILLDPKFFHESICKEPDFCEVKTKTVTFDALETTNGVRQKVNYTFIVAPQLPFLSRVLKYCSRYVAKASPRDYLEEICYDTVDFIVGQ